MSDTLHDLIGDMPAGGAEAWQGLAEKALRGAGFESTLVRRTADGLARGPVFFEGETAALPDRPRDPHLPWQIRQTFVDATTKSANAALLDDLMGGVTQIALQVDATGEFGIPLADAEELEAVLAGVELSIAPVFLEPGHSLDAGAVGTKLLALGASSGGLGLQADNEALLDLAAALPGFGVCSVDARCVHDTGGSEAQEIAYAAAGFAEALGRLVEGGVEADQAVSQIEVILAADADIHLSIAKIRAARAVLAQILTAYDANGAPAIRVVTSGRMMTRLDPWTNLIRLSAASFAASVSGADAVTILPATRALGRPDSFARRIVRNLHILLQEESHVGVVADPSAGSYLHETLARSLAEKGWAIFQDIEAAGGFGKLDADSPFVADVASARTALEKKYVSGAGILFGVNRYAADDLRDMRALKGSPPPSSDPLFPAICLEDAALQGEIA